MAKHPVLASGRPKMTGPGERQMDGTRTPTFSKPVRRAPMADRMAVPDRSAGQGGSGMEAAMGSLADKSHPC